jgi:uncharacterized protein (TIGR00730 family)
VLRDTRERLVKALGELQDLMQGGVEKALLDANDAQRVFEEGERAARGEAGGVAASEGKAKPAAAATAAKPATAAAAVSAMSPGAVRRMTRNLHAAVFGSSRCVEGDALWKLAEELGERLGEAGFHLITGGYCGTMEAVSRGASNKGRVVVEGIICPPVFPHRGYDGNEHLNSLTITNSLPERLMAFTQRADVYVVLPGNTGTLTEFMLVWNINIINKLSKKPPVPIFAFRDPWARFLDSVVPLLGVPKDDLASVTLVDSVADLMARLQQWVASDGPSLRTNPSGAASAAVDKSIRMG